MPVTKILDIATTLPSVKRRRGRVRERAVPRPAESGGIRGGFSLRGRCRRERLAGSARIRRATRSAAALFSRRSSSLRRRKGAGGVAGAEVAIWAINWGRITREASHASGDGTDESLSSPWKALGATLSACCETGDLGYSSPVSASSAASERSIRRDSPREVTILLPGACERSLPRKRKLCICRAFLGADEGTRTLDLLHGKDCARADRKRQEPSSPFGSVSRAGWRRLEPPATDSET
jgi:hypothetical protein